jgi:SNF2 family DNA or RNA helicase
MGLTATETFPHSEVGCIAISIEVEPSNSGWDIHLNLSEGAPKGPLRLRSAISKLLQSDSATKILLQKGEKVSLHVRRSSQSFTPTGAFTPSGDRSGLIQPLLMPLAIDDALYQFQRTGVAWLLQHKRALLADDMGLGKTPQALAAVRRLFRHGKVDRCLIIAPRTLLANWQEEAAIWAPELLVATALPSSSERTEVWEKAIRSAHLVLTSYENIRNPPMPLLDKPPDLIIADEAHRLRKASSQTTHGIRKIQSQRFWALTGTPVERDKEDIAVLLSILNPKQFSHVDSKRAINSLRSNLRPYLLRRKKSDVLDELPPVVESTELLELTTEQKTAYKKTLKTHRPTVGADGQLGLFGKLMRICDLDPDTKSSSKIDRIEEVLSDISKMNQKAVIFSHTLDPLTELGNRLERSMAPNYFVKIVGEMSLSERVDAINKFKHESACTVLLASSKVASEGLTLTEANHVLFINLWWNPSSNEQARDRVVRIGQTRDVYVRSFITQETVESRLTKLLEEKSLTFNQLIEALVVKSHQSLG